MNTARLPESGFSVFAGIQATAATILAVQQTVLSSVQGEMKDPTRYTLESISAGPMRTHPDRPRAADATSTRLIAVAVDDHSHRLERIEQKLESHHA